MNDADDIWHNIIVTKVLEGGMFWAQVGDETIKVEFTQSNIV